MRMLVVDDELEVAKALRRLFRREGFEVTIAGSAREALECLAAAAVDVVLSDYRMPEMNGAQFLTEVGARCPEARRMLISGFADLGQSNKGQVDWPFVSKPWDDAQLVARIRELVGTH